MPFLRAEFDVLGRRQMEMFQLRGNKEKGMKRIERLKKMSIAELGREKREIDLELFKHIGESKAGIFMGEDSGRIRALKKSKARILAILGGKNEDSL